MRNPNDAPLHFRANWRAESDSELLGLTQDTPAAPPLARRQAAVGLGLMVAGFLLASCAPQSPPAPGSWAEAYARRKQKYREWGQGTSSK